MSRSTAAIIDANINRAAEGLRVVEDYVRFVLSDTAKSETLATMRRTINQNDPHPAESLKIRDITQDARAKEIPEARPDLRTLLKANFKRSQEALRVLEEYTRDPLYNSLRYDTYQLEKDILLPLYQPEIKPGIYLISDSVDVLLKGIEWGVSIVQIRDKAAHKAEVLDKAKKVAPIAKKAQIPFIVNDFVDIAIAVDADGLHTGQDDIAITELRAILGAHKILGRTTHSLEQGVQAQQDGADYVSVGPIFETPSKPGRPGIGDGYLKVATEKLAIPYVAIGGLNQNNIDSVLVHRPPLVGLIRDWKNIPKLMSKFDHPSKS